jgi:hypothetical protein
MKFFKAQPSSATLLIYGASGTAQFTLTAGNPRALGMRNVSLLQDRARDVTTLVRRIKGAVSCGFRLDGGDVLLLGVPVAEPEQQSGRDGLCVVYVVHVSHHRLASPIFFMYMLFILNGHLARAIGSSNSSFEITAEDYTKLLQRQGSDELIALVSDQTGKISQFFTNVFNSMSRRGRRSFSASSKAGNLADYYKNPYSELCIRTASLIRNSRRINFCYYISYSQATLEDPRFPILRYPHLRAGYCSPTVSGLILSYSISRRRGLPVEMHGNFVTPKRD